MPEVLSRGIPHPHTRRCTHTHVSGRRCEVRVSKRDMYGSAVLFCPLHKGECDECKGMMAAFEPPSGWRI